MKVKVTKKSVMRSYSNIISVGYCSLQYLLIFQTPRFFTSGVYGWNADIYEIDGSSTAIVTGYNPFGNIKTPVEIVEQYDNRAKELYSSHAPIENIKKGINSLLQEFVDVVINK